MYVFQFLSCPSATFALQLGGFVPREWLLFVLWSKVDFPRKFGTLHNIDLLQLPQIFKLNLAKRSSFV